MHVPLHSSQMFSYVGDGDRYSCRGKAMYSKNIRLTCRYSLSIPDECCDVTSIAKQPALSAVLTTLEY
jgi:hypothetical protein